MLPAARNSMLRTALRRAQPTTAPQYSAFARLASTFAVLEQKDGKFQPASLAAVTAGTKLGGSITAFIAGSGVKSVAEEIGKAKGIEKVIYVENGAYDKVRTLRRIQLGSSLTCSCRVYPRTMRHSWSRT
jgi:electron transfer flavoprotein alpha subunit